MEKKVQFAALFWGFLDIYFCKIVWSRKRNKRLILKLMNSSYIFLGMSDAEAVLIYAVEYCLISGRYLGAKEPN